MKNSNSPAIPIRSVFEPVSIKVVNIAPLRVLCQSEDKPSLQELDGLTIQQYNDGGSI